MARTRCVDVGAGPGVGAGPCSRGQGGGGEEDIAQDARRGVAASSKRFLWGLDRTALPLNWE